MLKQLMEQDDGACRGVEGVALHGREESPGKALSNLGSRAYSEPMVRSDVVFDDYRAERQKYGIVKFRREPHIPVYGSIGMRTKCGHMLKNQAYYPQLSKNKWEFPAHAGVNNWKEFHGPRLRTDADTMEAMDRFEEREELNEAKKTFTNTVRVQTLDRFYNQKLERRQLEAAREWAPHHKARREVHSTFETFEDRLDEKPVKELKKVLTKTVLKGDREAVRAIAKRMQNEETWKLAWQHMEKERRDDIRADLQHRQAHNDMLMHASGQPVRAYDSSKSTITSATQRSHELAQHRPLGLPKDVTQHTDFRGLIHADNSHALETLLPGRGHEISTEFRAMVRQSVEPGYPPPEPARTPRKSTRASQLGDGEPRLSMFSIPTSSQRLEKLGTRNSPDKLHVHAKEQFLSTTAPPAPDQRYALLNEDWSPITTQQDPARVTGDFLRTDASVTGTSWRSGGGERHKNLPPPTRSLVYPMLSPTSPSRNKLQSKLLQHTISAPEIPTKLAGAASGKGSGSMSTAELCQHLDDFEAKAKPVPGITNFFGTPRASRARRG